MPRENAIAEVGLRLEVHPIRAQGIETTVVQTVNVDQSVGGPWRQAKEIGAVVAERGAERQAAIAEVVDVEQPIGPLRLLANAEDLVGVELREDLRAEDFVVLELRAAQIERGLLEIGG